MIHMWAKVIIALIVVAIVLGVVWLVVRMATKPSPGPGPSPNSPIKPSEYTGTMSAPNPPTTATEICAPNLDNPANGVGWVLNNQTSQNLTLSIASGSNCNTTPSRGAYTAIPSSAPCLPGQKMTWTQASYVLPLAVGQGVNIFESGTGQTVFTPTNINPATQYVMFTVTETNGTYTYSVDTYSY